MGISRQQVDVVVLGLGPGGEYAARKLAEAGLRVVGVDRALVGGECPFWGCTPSKLMVRPADLLAEAHRAPALAGDVDVRADWSLVAARIREANHDWTDHHHAGPLEEAGVRIVRGHGRLTGPGRVRVETDDGHVDLEAAREFPCHQGLVLLSERGTALGRVGPDKQVHLVRGDREAFGIHGRSAEQRVALEMLLDPEVGIVSLGGRAGTGKSALALCAGLEAVMERGQHKKVVVFRPLFAVGGQELGYLPGSEGEKMAPWAQAVFDTLGAITSREVIEHVLDRGMLEVLPLTHIRGRSLHDAYVIVDEAQSLERNVLLTVLSRIGANSKVVLTHDVAQRDNLRVGRHDGVVAVVEKLKGHPLFAHVTLTRSERSPVAALVTEMLENVTL